MRYYDIRILNTDNSEVKRWTTETPSGGNNPAALKVYLDIPANNMNSPAGIPIVRIWGISYKDLVFTSNIVGKRIVVRGGMSKGLPLANPDQQAILTSGLVFKAFGNWQGNEITLDIIITPNATTNSQPANIVFNWPYNNPNLAPYGPVPPNISFTQAVTSSLQNAYKGYEVTGSFSDLLTPIQSSISYYRTLHSFAYYVYQLSLSRSTIPNYLGANIYIRGKTFVLYDGTKQLTAAPKQISFLDFIGNPTWLELNVMQFKVVMRGDLEIGMQIQLPQRSNALNTVQSFSSFKDEITFQGIWTISKIRHVGQSRATGADNWVTIVDCTPLVPSANSIEQFLGNPLEAVP